TAVPTRHDFGRWRKGGAPEAIGYVVAGGGVALHHAGDVDFSDHAIFDDIGKRHAIDVALLPIGGLLPVWYYRWRRNVLDRGIHIDPDCALDIFERLGARTLVPVHWGTMNLPLGLPGTPRRRLARIAHERGKTHAVRILAHGESLGLASARSHPLEHAVEAQRSYDTDHSDHDPHRITKQLVGDQRVAAIGTAQPRDQHEVVDHPQSADAAGDRAQK